MYKRYNIICPFLDTNNCLCDIMRDYVRDQFYKEFNLPVVDLTDEEAVLVKLKFGASSIEEELEDDWRED